jgi:guanylate kinase
MNGQVFVFSGPSGAGKTTIIQELRKRIKDLGYSISHTSRLPRKNEKTGVDYHFVKRDTFKEMIKEGAFVEFATVYSDLYGTSFSSLIDQIEKGFDVILDVDSQGAKNIKRRLKDGILIYILPPSLEVLENRLRERATDDPDVIEARISQAREELKDCAFYDYLIINDDLEKSVQEAEAIILSDRCRKTRTLSKIKERFGDC